MIKIIFLKFQYYSSVWVISCHALKKARGLEVLRSSFCEEVIRHGSEIFISVLQNSSEHCVKNLTQHFYIGRPKTNSGPNKNCAVFTSCQQISQMLIALSNYSLYIFHVTGDIYCICVNLHVRVVAFSSLKYCTYTLWSPKGHSMS